LQKIIIIGNMKTNHLKSIMWTLLELLTIFRKKKYTRTQIKKDKLSEFQLEINLKRSQ